MSIITNRIIQTTATSLPSVGTVVENVTALRALAGSVNLPAAALRQYSDIANLGGGVFVWSDTAAVDDDGWVLNSGGYGTSSAGWRRITDSSVYNLADFGAVPGQDITTIFQRVLTAAKVAGGADIFVPAGTFYLSENIGVANATGIVIRGAGRGVTILSDSRAQSSDTAPPTANYYGLLSFDTCSSCGVEDLTLSGTCDSRSTLDGVMSTNLARKAVYFHSSPYCWLHRVGATLFRDEAFLADGTSHAWHVTYCRVYDTNSNGVNLNDHFATEGGVVHGNVCIDCFQAGVSVGGRSVTVTENIISSAFVLPGHVTGASMMVVDVGARAVISGNIFHDTDTRYGGAAALDIFGTASAAASLTVSDNVFVNMQGLYSTWPTGGRGCLAIWNGFSGVASITGNVFNNCGASGSTPDDHAAITIQDSSGRIYVAGNVVKRGTEACMDTGLVVASNVTAGTVVIGDNDFGECPTPYNLAVATLGKGSGSPEGAVIGNVGDQYSDTTNGVSYVKNTGAGTNTGWAANLSDANIAAITGSLSTVADAPAKAVLTSIIAALVAIGAATDGTT